MTTRSFLPNNCTLINALTCCANINCNKKAEPLALKMCTACRSSYYCDVDCQKTHRKHHKHQCKQDAQDIKRTTDHIAKSNHRKEKSDDSDCDDDDAFFQPIPPKDDCPICTQPLSIDREKTFYNACCGNLICDGCNLENRRVTRERGLDQCCAFCREPSSSSDDEIIVRIKTRMDTNDSAAIFLASQCYKLGRYGLPQDSQKAFELCLRASELGNSEACGRAAGYYNNGEVVAKDMAKQREYLRKAVKKGNVHARHNLGATEWSECNYRLASRHYLTAAAAGYAPSLEKIAKLYQMKLVTKKEYSIALTSYGNVHKDELSIERERAAAATR